MATKKKQAALVATQRKVQREIDAKKPQPKKKDKAVQAHSRRKPENPFPKQHQAKPGIEAKLKP
ncbi:MAG TPA: hypothetical protein VF147_00845, partial [Vicinamibacterales bacterium]